MKTYAHKNACAQMFIADLFIVAWETENNSNTHQHVNG